ncbi:MAG: translation elongation factor Ts [Actinobacteria bacterium]|jgi:elongation factor Ts|nr:translation elongation factor Ts [Actinomycetota bacterium]
MPGDFTAQDVQKLRQMTGAGMLDAKHALESNGGDMEEAKQWLRVKGLASAAKRNDREAVQGAISLVIKNDVAAVVELRCETDFVAKAPPFVAAAEQLANMVVVEGEQAVEGESGLVEELRTSFKENISIGRTARIESGRGNAVGGYLHTQAGRGVNAVVVVLAGGTEELAHDIAVHIAFAKPQYISRDEVPDDIVAAERETLTTITRNEGKPEAALEKIVSGRLNGFFKERCLLEQPYVRDEKLTISDLLGDSKVVRFLQMDVG